MSDEEELVITPGGRRPKSKVITVSPAPFTKRGIFSVPLIGVTSISARGKNVMDYFVYRVDTGPTRRD